MTPLAIEILLHFHVSPLPHPLSAYPAVADEIESQLRDGLIEEEKASYRTTERGKAHIRQLCNLPFPTQMWADKDGNKI